MEKDLDFRIGQVDSRIQLQSEQEREEVLIYLLHHYYPFNINNWKQH